MKNSCLDLLFCEGVVHSCTMPNPKDSPYLHLFLKILYKKHMKIPQICSKLEQILKKLFSIKNLSNMFLS